MRNTDEFGNGPMVSAYDPNKYRSILKRNLTLTPSHAVFVSDTLRRFYTEETLPTEIKSNLGMILTTYTEPTFNEPFMDNLIRNGNYMPHSTLNAKEGFKDIGWRLSESYFCVVISVKLLNDMRGETL